MRTYGFIYVCAELMCISARKHEDVSNYHLKTALDAYFHYQNLKHFKLSIHKDNDMLYKGMGLFRTRDNCFWFTDRVLMSAFIRIIFGSWILVT